MQLGSFGSNSNGSVSVSEGLDNTGTIQMYGGSSPTVVSVGKGLTNEGYFYVQGGYYGAGSLTVGGDLTNSGQMTIGNNWSYGDSYGNVSVTGNAINSGTLYIYNQSSSLTAAKLTNSGTINNTSSGVINIGTTAGTSLGSLTMGSGATLDEVIKGAGSGLHGVINLNGGASLDGTLDITTSSGFSFAMGESFVFMNLAGGQLSGNFATLEYGSLNGSGLNPLNLGNGLALDLVYDNTDGAVALDVVSGITPPGVNVWQGGTDGWNNGPSNLANWSSQNPPQATDDVTIGIGAGGTVTYNDSNDTVKSLTVQGGSSSNYALTFSAGDLLTVTNAITIDQGGEIDVSSDGASLTGASLANYGALNVSNGGALTVNGDTTNSGYIQVGAPSYNGTSETKMSVNGSLTNNNSMVVGSYGNTGSTFVEVGATFDNTGGSLQIIGGDTAGASSAMQVDGAAPPTLQGSISIHGYTGGAYLNYGSGGITRIGDGASNTGSLTLDGANAFIGVGASNPTTNSALTGLADIAANGSLSIQDGATVDTTPSSGTLTNAGVLYVGYGGAGPGSTLNITGNLTNSNTMQVGTSWSGSNGMVTVSGDFNNTGNYSISSGSTSGSTMTVQGAASNSGTMSVNGGGALTVANGIVNNVGGSLNYTGGNINSDLTNNGTTTLSGSGTGDTRTITGNVVNNGTFNVSNTTATYTGTFKNNGAYISDPSVSNFTTLKITSSGYLALATGDQINISQNFFSESTNNLNWNTTGAVIDFTGTTFGGTQVFDINGKDGGGFKSNFAWGTLDITGTETVKLVGTAGGAALYADQVMGIAFNSLNQITNLSESGVTIYYNPKDNPGLSGIYALATGGYLVPSGSCAPTPIPNPAWLLGTGLACLVALKREYLG